MKFWKTLWRFTVGISVDFIFPIVGWVIFAGVFLPIGYFEASWLKILMPGNLFINSLASFLCAAFSLIGVAALGGFLFSVWNTLVDVYYNIRKRWKEASRDASEIDGTEYVPPRIFVRRFPKGQRFHKHLKYCHSGRSKKTKRGVSR